MDEITIEISEGASGVSVFSEDGAMPKDDTNLAVRAAKLMRFDGFDDVGVAISIDKKIPQAAGLAGGSADAAAVMLALASTSRVEGLTAPVGAVSLSELTLLGIKLGADVPFCICTAAKANPLLGFSGDELAQGTLWAEGIGEKLSPLKAPRPKASVVLIKPKISVATPTVFKLLDDEPLWVPRTGPAEMFENDLELVTPKAFPVVAEILAWLRANEVGGVSMMSGSGPTCFSYIEQDPCKPDEAKSLAARLYSEAKKAFPEFEVFLVETL
ncbi:MAG: hypothetical protein LBN34_08210 [Clostridiales Family XIII bacterium]|nr:hypothetical protein [Clostridiales Family XIII bacterium]